MTRRNICEDCGRDLNRQNHERTCRTYSRERRARNNAAQKERMLAGDPAVPHGTRGGYCNWQCRCDDCTAAFMAANRPNEERYRARQKAKRNGTPIPKWARLRQDPGKRAR